MTEYGNDSISQIQGPDAIRLRPEATLGSNGIDGALHGVTEIIGNALDEAGSGYGDRIVVEREEDGHISVRDFGRGVPLGYNSKAEKWNFELIYMEPYAGGKFEGQQEKLLEIIDWNNFNPRDFSYLFSVGLNGLGAMATQSTSRDFQVKSFRDGEVSEMRYERGYNIWEELKVEKTDEPNGTYVRWIPDDEVFTDIDIKTSYLRGYLSDQSYVSEIETVLIADGKEEVFPKRTIADMLEERVDVCVYGEQLHHETRNKQRKSSIDDNGRNEEVVICWSKIAIGPAGVSNRFFHNQVSVRGGVHEDAVNSAINQFLVGIGKRRGIKLNASDMSGAFSVVISSFSNLMSYRGQTKDSLDDNYIFRALQNHLTNLLEQEMAKGTSWIKAAVESVMEKAERRIQLEELAKQTKMLNKAVSQRSRPDKFVACKTYGKDAEKTEFWLLEGDSAAGAFKLARDPETQCYMAMRGKVLNVFKSPVEKILENKEIQGIINILRTGATLDGVQKFDRNKLAVGKVIIGSDADVDGFHIRILVFLVFYKLFPELLREGLLYIAEPPRYEIVKKNGQKVYCVTELERKRLVKEIGDHNIKEINRFKGLGEMNPPELRETTVAPETRHLVQVKVDPNDPKVAQVMEDLFGESTMRRKQLILEQLMGVSLKDVLDELDELDGLLEDMQIEDDMETIAVEY